eukprot:3841139-Rhodomonas_salina.1
MLRFVIPATLQTTPGGQGSQSELSVRPVRLDQVPVGQNTQLTLSSHERYVPAGHGVGLTVPSEAQYPGVAGTGADTPAGQKYPRGHGAVPCGDPAACSQYVPSTQIWAASNLPGTVRFVATPMRQYVPGGHGIGLGSSADEAFDVTVPSAHQYPDGQSFDQVALPASSQT